MDAIIKTKDLSKSYKKFTALQPTTVTIEKGSIYGLIGRNGAGKTTLIKLLLGLIKPTEGEMSLFGQTGNAIQHARRRIGAIVEQPAFFPSLTGRQNLEYYRIQKGIAEKSTVEKVINQLNLQQLANKKFKTYSLGNKQRLGIALALLGNPDLLILDEPINGFDPMGIIEIRKILLELNQKHHMTILISSHILAELENLITHVGFIDNGQLVQQMEMEELRQHCRKYIQLKVNAVDKAVALLEHRLGFNDIQLVENNTVHIYAPTEVIPAITRTLNEGNVSVLAISEVEQNLEDYFVELVGGAHHD